MQSPALQMLPEEKWTREGQQVLSVGQKVNYSSAWQLEFRVEQRMAASFTLNHQQLEQLQRNSRQLFIQLTVISCAAS